MQIRPSLLTALAAFLALTGCTTPEMQKKKAARQVMEDEVRREEPGKYYVGRRSYKVDYKFWGFVRKPGQQWITA